MGSSEDCLRKNNPHQQQHTTKFKLKILLLVILTNLLTIYIFTSPSSFHLGRDLSHYTNHFSLPLPWPNTTALSIELRSTQAQLAATRSQLAELHQRLHAIGGILAKHQDVEDGPSDEFAALAGLPDEVKLSLGPHALPLGYSPRSGSDTIYPSVGAACLRYKDDLVQYMKYEVGGECPVDDVFAQRLLLKGCEPLPRRRCRPRSPKGYVDPAPYPECLWQVPPDPSIIWEPYNCKNYRCLVDRKNQPGFFDCKDCFDLNGREKARWLFDNGNLDYSIEYVLKTKLPDTIRIGLDIGGGSGTFAARMRERNVTIITTSMNLDGPFNSFIASRGLIPMHMSVSQRLPFFENTLDIVHSMHVLSNWVPDTMLEFTFYDVYRVLRPGGLLWLDRFFCKGPQLNQTYVPMIDRVGFKKIRWNAGMKLDKNKNEWYFSALLEKPMS
ncbi:hypothetical protein CDL15_Pgr027614 [Punica granatum]|uniref:Methyltransferase type 11 domain-containing protein n=1 Tax=Punica granatum TaxID=22663 RepID=A0A218XIR2_PUNGR|nr:hypothetical protein CDL15_Pgr027614 [Punica granatum]